MVSSSSAKAPNSPGMSDASGSDSPPSYDYVASLPNDDVYPYVPAVGSSTSSGAAGSAVRGVDARGTAKHIEHVFAGPRNAETLLAKNSRQLEPAAGISTHRSWGHMVSFDPRLQNADTLYDFIQYQALQVPTVKIKICGSHKDRATIKRTVRTTQHPDGRTETETVHETSPIDAVMKVVEELASEDEEVVDFDFWIDLRGVLDHWDNISNIHLRAVGPEDPVHRGTFNNHYAAQYRAPEVSRFPAFGDVPDAEGYASLLPASEYSATDVGARAGHSDGGYTQVERNKWFWSKGFPLWTDVSKIPEFWAERAGGTRGKEILPVNLPEESATSEEAGGGSIGDHSPHMDEPALRAWCLKYCQDPGVLKSFRMSKWCWGWETSALASAIKGAILSTGYQGDDIKIDWDMGQWAVTVRPPNFFSRLVWDTPWYLMVVILILYPLIWLWQRAYSTGGAPYSIARASYAFKFYPPLPDTFPNETVQAAQERLPALSKLHPELPKSPTLQLGPNGVHYLLGRKEGEWFREWEERIRMGVRMKYKGELQDTISGEQEAPMLDGY